jgi:hypothetical protein
MALATAYLARRSLARSLGRSLAVAGSGAASLTWIVLLRTGRIMCMSLEAVSEAQELRRKLVQKYPFSDV